MTYLRCSEFSVNKMDCLPCTTKMNRLDFPELLKYLDLIIWFSIFFLQRTSPASTRKPLQSTNRSNQDDGNASTQYASTFKPHMVILFTSASQMFNSSSGMQEIVEWKKHCSIRPGVPLYWACREAQRSMYFFFSEACEPFVEGTVLIFVAVMFFLQFYLKLEEKHQAMEEEKTQLEAKLKVCFIFLPLISHWTAFASSCASVPFVMFRLSYWAES